MIKYFLACLLTTALFSCNNGSNDAKTNSSATDTTQTPNGVSNGSVMSTDTAATRIDSTQHK